MEKRSELDFLNVIMCVFVVFIHIISKAVTALDSTSVQYAMVFIPSRLMQFVVQGFVFLSAFKYFMNNKNEGYFEFIISRFKKIYVPYVVWNVIFYLLLIPLGYFIFNIVELLKYILLGNMISHFYFVVIIMQFYLLMPLWKWALCNVNNKILLIISFVLMIVFGNYVLVGYKYSDRIFVKYIFYWIFGCVAGKNSEQFFGLIKKNIKVITILFIIAALSDSTLSLLNSLGVYRVSFLENIHIIYCILAIVFLLAVWKNRKTVDNLAFKIINKESYNIYLSHCIVLYYVDYFMNRIEVYDMALGIIARVVGCWAAMVLLWGANYHYQSKKHRLSGS